MTDHPLTRSTSAPPPEPSPRRAGSERSIEYADFGDEKEGVDFRRYVAALFRYKWMILLSALLGAGGAYLSWGNVDAEYVAQGSLWVSVDNSDGAGPIITDGLLPAPSWVDLLRSFSIVDPVVMDEKLYVRPGRAADLPLFDDFEIAEEFTPGSYRLVVSEDGRRFTLYRDRTVVGQGAPGDPVGAAAGIHWIPPADALEAAREISFLLITPTQAARLLQEQIEARMDPQGRFIRIELRGLEPRRLGAVVAGLMERHVELAAELKSGHLDEQTEVLARQLQQVEVELAEAERRLESFRVETVTLPSEQSGAIEPGLEMTRGPVFDAFFQMRVEQEQLRRDRERLENVLATLPDSAFPVEAVELIPVVATSTELRAGIATLVEARRERRSLLERYTPEYSEVRALTERIETLEQSTLPSLMRQLVAQLDRDEASLADRIERSGVDLSSIPSRTIEEGRLRRQVVINENLYTQLRSRYEISNLARRSSVPDVRILDRAAVREVPVTDLRVRLALLILFGCLGIGVAGALLLDRMDSRVRTPDEISDGMGLFVLGTVPHVRSANGSKKSVRDARQVREAFRELRTNLTYAYGAAGPLVLTISSSGMGEGKTLVSANLAVAFSELGRRTLILDADTRRGDLHNRFLRARRPGLTDFLRGASRWDDVLQDTDHPHLDFIGSGTQVENSPELLSSPEMGKMFSNLRTEYDVILVDSPPFGAGADALVLSSITGHLLLVVRSGTTHREFTQSKLEPLNRLPVRLLGAVLNDFRPQRIGAYQGRYYGTYLPGYEAGREEPGEEPEAAPPLVGPAT